MGIKETFKKGGFTWWDDPHMNNFEYWLRHYFEGSLRWLGVCFGFIILIGLFLEWGASVDPSFENYVPGAFLLIFVGGVGGLFIGTVGILYLARHLLLQGRFKEATERTHSGFSGSLFSLVWALLDQLGAIGASAARIDVPEQEWTEEGRRAYAFTMLAILLWMGVYLLTIFRFIFEMATAA